MNISKNIKSPSLSLLLLVPIVLTTYLSICGCSSSRMTENALITQHGLDEEKTIENPENSVLNLDDEMAIIQEHVKWVCNILFPENIEYPDGDIIYWEDKENQSEAEVWAGLLNYLSSL